MAARRAHHPAPARRERLRGGRRLLAAQRELPFQTGNLAIALGQFLAEPLNLSLQSLDLLRLAAYRERRTSPEYSPVG